jgi:hypothetical protein
MVHLCFYHGRNTFSHIDANAATCRGLQFLHQFSDHAPFPFDLSPRLKQLILSQNLALAFHDALIKHHDFCFISRANHPVLTSMLGPSVSGDQLPKPRVSHSCIAELSSNMTSRIRVYFSRIACTQSFFPSRQIAIVRLNKLILVRFHYCFTLSPLTRTIPVLQNYTTLNTKREPPETSVSGALNFSSGVSTQVDFRSKYQN